MTLVDHAIEARKSAYAPYSDFLVGAALKTKSGKIYTGGNIENASFSVTLCAERTAFARAIADGETEFSEIAIVGGKRDQGADKCCPPCGVCRQFMREFCDDSFRITLLEDGKEIELKLEDLLPHSFRKEIERGEL